MDIDHIRRVEYNQQYILGMRPVFNHGALFSDTTENYISPAEPKSGEAVKIRFRTARNNVDRVFFVQKEEKTLMSVAESDEYFDYYEIERQLGTEKFTYHFQVETGRLSVSYDVRGVTQDTNDYYNFVIIPGFQTPKWAKGAVMYRRAGTEGRGLVSIPFQHGCAYLPRRGSAGRP